MFHIYLDENTGIVKMMQENQDGVKLFSSFATVQDFCNALAANAKIETPILPQSCFKYMSTQESMSVFLFYSGRKLDFSIHDRGAHGPEKINIYVPNTVIQARLSLPNESKTMMLQGAKIFFTDSIIPVEKMKMYKPPFPNVYADGQICFGSVHRGTYPSDNLMGIDSVYNMFFGNVANWDLYRGEKIGKTKYENPVELLREIEKMSPEETSKVYFSSEKFLTVFSSSIA